MVTVSIILCTYNRQDKLRKSLEALQRMSSSPSWEAVIVDNASTDNTAEVVRELAAKDARFRYFFEGQQGLGAARDTAWRLASGEFITFTDDDCYAAEDFVEKIVQTFQERPELDHFGGRVLLFNQSDAPKTIKTTTEPFEIPPKAYVAAGILIGANMSFRPKVLETIGGFDRDLGAGSSLRSGEDIDVIAAASWHGFRGGYDPRPTVWHDHGRKLAEIPKLDADYDAGRGAYFAKYMLNRESRLAYLKGFLRQPMTERYVDEFARTRRYLIFGNRYLQKKGKHLAYCPFSILVLTHLVATMIRRIGRRLGLAA